MPLINKFYLARRSIFQSFLGHLFSYNGGFCTVAHYCIVPIGAHLLFSISLEQSFGSGSSWIRIVGGITDPDTDTGGEKERKSVKIKLF